MTTLVAVTGKDVVRLRQDNRGQWQASRILQDAGAQCLAIDPHQPQRIIVGTFENGVFLTSDGGQSWRQTGAGIPHERVLSVAISPSRPVNGTNTLYAGTEPSSIFVSEDDGETWRDLPALRSLPSAPTWSFPPRPWTSHVRWMAPSWHDPDLLFAGIELGGVMRSIDGGETWEDRKPGLYHDCHCIQTHPEDPTRVYEAAGGGVAMSVDACESWSPVDEGMDRHYAWSVAVDPQDPECWFVSAAPGPRNAHGDQPSAEAVIYRKRGSAAWTALTGGLEPPIEEMPYALLIPRDERRTVFAGTRQGSLFVSNDQGDTWTRTGVDVGSILHLAHAPD